MSPQPPAPFSCTYSPNLPELLQQLHCTLVLSTFQAGKVIFLSAVNDEKLIQLPRTFRRPMGLATDRRRLAIATQDEVLVLTNDPNMAPNYPPKPKTYDGLYLPRALYFTGQVDLHDMAFSKQGLITVNTRFSCLAKMSHDYSFEPIWQPHFISKLTPEDRCHLNGVAMQGGEPKYVTALGQTDVAEGWRDRKADGGVLIDIASQEIVTADLPMPHSPRLYDGKLYVLLSATGELAQVDLNTGRYEVVNRLEGFVRGMAQQGDYLFIGLSKLRKNSSSFHDLPIAEKAKHCGLVVLHLPTGSIVGQLTYQASVDELYDVKILPGLRRPNVLNHQKEDHRIALSLPDTGYWLHTPDEQSATNEAEVPSLS